jgi:CHASE2 domain-containing sensor protein
VNINLEKDSNKSRTREAEMSLICWTIGVCSVVVALVLVFSVHSWRRIRHGILYINALVVGLVLLSYVFLFLGRVIAALVTFFSAGAASLSALLAARRHNPKETA